MKLLKTALNKLRRDRARNGVLAAYWHHKITAQECAKRLGEIDRRYGQGRWA